MFATLLLGVILGVVLCSTGCFSLQSSIPAELQAVGDLFRDSFVDESETLSPECSAGFNQLMNTRDQLNISKFYRILDASGKPEAGLFDGNIYAYGSYDECLDTDGAKYCVLQFLITIAASTVPYSFALCLPAACTTTDIYNVINDTTLRTNYVEAECVLQRTSPYGPGAIIMIAVCCLFVLLSGIGTAIDTAIRRLNTENKTSFKRISSKRIEDGEINHGDKQAVSDTEVEENATLLDESKKKNAAPLLDLITAFSLHKTLPTIFSTHQPLNAIGCINGIRVISMFWVITGHVYFFGITYFDNAFVVLDVIAKQFPFQIIVNAFFSVDTFFFLSGLLTSYLTLQQMSRQKGRFPLVAYYLHRYLRLTPTLAFVMFFWWSMAPHLFWNAHGNEATVIGARSACEKYWWSNLLYINNFYPYQLNSECIGWVWYLATDMQFYIISPPILWLLFRFLPLGVISLFILLGSSLIATGAIAGYYQYYANIFIRSNPAYSDDIYVKPYCRIAPYLVGLALGYVFFKKLLFKSHRLVLNYSLYGSLWVLAAGLLMACVYGLYGTWNQHPFTAAGNVSYIMLSHLAWGVGLGCVTYACHSGYGGWVNTFLSLGFWVPLSRLTFSAYLVHPIVLGVLISAYTGTIHYNVLIGVQLITATVVLSYAAAGVLAIFVEFPLGSLEAALFKIFGLVKR